MALITVCFWAAMNAGAQVSDVSETSATQMILEWKNAARMVDEVTTSGAVGTRLVLDAMRLSERFTQISGDTPQIDQVKFMVGLWQVIKQIRDALATERQRNEQQAQQIQQLQTGYLQLKRRMDEAGIP